MKRILLLILLLLLLAGCGNQVITGSEAIETEATEAEALAPESSALDTKAPEVAIEEEEVKEEQRLVYEPEPVTESTPIFVSATLDLSSSTPEEIVIKILYFDKDGEPANFTLPGGHGRTSVRVWKGPPPTHEEGKRPSAEWHEEHALLKSGWQDYCEFMIVSSEDVLVIPTSTVLPCSDDELTVELAIDVSLWGADFGEGSFKDPAWSAIYAPFQKNW